MNYKEILSRLTGFSIPIFGVSWDPPEAERATARKVLAFLEDRRVLYNPFHLEMEEHCIRSVIEIRHFLTDVIGSLPSESKLVEHLRAIRAACRQLLDDSGPGGRRRVRPYYGGHHETEFFTALGELRATIGIHVAAIAVMHGLDVERELAKVLPPASEGDEDV
jgi:hypothetical protein